MKKILSFIIVSLSLCFVLSGCNMNTQNTSFYLTNWIEVANVIYSNYDTNSNSTSSTYIYNTTFSSKYSLTCLAPEVITEQEFLESDINHRISPSGDLPFERNKISSIKNSYIYYQDDSNPFQSAYYKRFCTDYEITYVRIRFCSSNVIEIKYGNEAPRMINALSYTIQYFSDYNG